MSLRRLLSVLADSRSREGAWIESPCVILQPDSHAVTPARERGLKSDGLHAICPCSCRSREGAWIEIRKLIATLSLIIVAPARERGLKYRETIHYR